MKTRLKKCFIVTILCLIANAQNNIVKANETIPTPNSSKKSTPRDRAIKKTKYTLLYEVKPNNIISRRKSESSAVTKPKPAIRNRSYSTKTKLTKRKYKILTQAKSFIKNFYELIEFNIIKLIPRILIVSALPEEHNSVLKKLGWLDNPKIKKYSDNLKVGKYKGLNLVVANCGKGYESTCTNLTYIFENFKIYTAIFVGIAGNLDKKNNIYDVCIAQNWLSHTEGRVYNEKKERVKVLEVELEDLNFNADNKVACACAYLAGKSNNTNLQEINSVYSGFEGKIKLELILERDRGCKLDIKSFLKYLNSTKSRAVKEYNKRYSTKYDNFGPFHHYPQKVFKCDEKLFAIVKNMPKRIKCINGDEVRVKTCQYGGSGSVFVDNKDYAKHLKENLKLTIVDMESASFAFVCERYEIPFLVIRGLSDNSGDNGADGKNNIDKKTYNQIGPRDIAANKASVVLEVFLDKLIASKDVMNAFVSKKKQLRKKSSLLGLNSYFFDNKEPAN